MSDGEQAAERDEGGVERWLTEESLPQLERFRTAHATQVLTILLSDLEGSTRQQDALGNVRAAELVRQHRAIFRETLEPYDGEEVETAGDSFLAVFAAPSEGVKFALQLQKRMREAQAATPELPSVRVGLHQGQVVVERHEAGPKAMDIYGLQVSTAARIMDLGTGGQVLCSRAVFDDARAILRGGDFAGLGTVAWCNHGPYRFKGVEDSYEVCEVGEEGLAPLARPRGSSKSWPADQLVEELGWRPAVGVTVPETSWVLEERLGREEGDGGRFRGEFGEVWKAWNRSDKSHQVFKFCFKRDRVPALKREARLLKRLRKYRHPNLVEVYDVTEGDRPPYYLEMEYVDGPLIDAWLAGDPPLEERLEAVAQVADALDTVHAAGIFHRDIKPSNLLLTRREDGTLLAKLTDFGLGSAEDEELLKSIMASRVSGVAGTWDYIAPEVREGGRATAQSDLYSLGITLYQLAAGDLHRPLTGDWESPIASEVLRDDIRRCVASDAAARWPSASDLAVALRSHGQRLRQRALERAQALHQRRTKRLRAILGVVALFAVVVGGFGGYAWRQRAAAQRERDYALAAANAIIQELTAGISKPIPGYTGDQARLIQRAQDVYDRLMAQMPEREDIVQSKADALKSLADVYQLLGDAERARNAVEQRLPIVRKLADAAPADPERVITLLQALHAVIAARKNALDHEGATAATTEMIASLDRLGGLVAEESDWRWAAPIIQLYYKQNLQTPAGLAVDLQETLKEFEDAIKEFPGGREAALVALASLLSRLQGHQIKELTGFDDVRSIMEWVRDGMPPTGPASETAAGQQQHAIRLAMQALAHANNGDLQNAAASFEESAKILRRLRDADATNANWTLSLAELLIKYASFRDGRLEDTDGAVALYEEAARGLTALVDADRAAFPQQRALVTTLRSLTRLYRYGKRDLDAAQKANARLRALLRRLAAGGIREEASLAAVGRWLAQAIETESELRGETPDLEAMLRWLNTSAALYDRILARQPDHADTLESLATICLDIGRAKDAMDNHLGAHEAAERAVAVRRKLADAAPDDPLGLDELANALEQRAWARDRLGNAQGRLDDRREIVRLRKQICTFAPGNELWQRALSRALDDLDVASDPSDALAAQHDNVALCRRWHAAHPTDAAWTESLATALYRLGLHAQAAGRGDDALAAFGQSARLYESLLEAQPDTVRLLLSLNASSWLAAGEHHRRGETLAALEAYRKTLACARKARALEPGRLSHALSQATAAREIAALTLRCLGDAGQAVRVAEEAAQAIGAPAATPADELRRKGYLAPLYKQVALARQAQRDAPAAQAARERWLENLGAVLDAEPGDRFLQRERVYCLADLAADRATQRDLDGARTCLEKALERAKGLAAEDPADAPLPRLMAQRLEALGQLAARLGRLDALRREATALATRRALLQGLIEALDSLTQVWEYRARPVIEDEILTLASRLYAEHPAAPGLLSQTSAAISRVANGRRAAGRLRAFLKAARAAAEHFRTARAARPGDYGIHYALVGSLASISVTAERELGDLAAVRAALGEMAKLAAPLLAAAPQDPADRRPLAAALNSIAWSLLTSSVRDVPGRDAALRPCAERACTLSDWKEANFIDTLAHVHEQLGDRAKAAELQRKAVALAPDDPSLKAFLSRLEAPEPPTKAQLAVMAGGEDTVDAVAFGPDATAAISFCRGEVISYDGKQDTYLRKHPASARVWDTEAGAERRRFEDLPQFVQAFAASHDGARAATLDGLGALRVWAVATGRCTATFRGPFGEAKALAFLPDGRHCAIACGRLRLGEGEKETWRDNHVVRIWGLETGKEAGAFEGHKGRLESVAVSRDGQLVLSSSYERAPVGAPAEESRVTLCLWRTADGAEVGRVRLDPKAARFAALSPDAQIVLTGGRDGTVGIRRSDGFGVVAELKNEGQATSVLALAFTPDGRRILAGYDDCTFRVWDRESAKELAVHRHHAGPVTALAVSADGTRALTGSADTSLRVWKLPR